MTLTQLRIFFALGIVGFVGGCATRPNPPTTLIEQTADSVRWLSQTGQEVLRYQLKQPMGTALNVESACYFHPLKTPAGVTVTDVAPADHRHHRGIFFAWLEMHGPADADFWGWGQYAPTKGRRIINHKVETKGGDTVVFHNRWMADDVVVIEEELEARVNARTNANIVELTYTLTPSGDLKLPRWAFGGFAVRGLKRPALINSSEGEPSFPAPNHMKPETDWPNRAWYAYTFDLAEGKKAGIAVYNDPSNPPSLWHNAASIALLNPCSVAPEAVELKAGRPVTFKYRVMAFDGPPSNQIGETKMDLFAQESSGQQTRE